MIEESQEQEQTQLERLKTMHGWDKQGQSWRKEGKLVVISDQVKKEILKEHHDYPTAGHPRIASTYFSIRTCYWWPNMKEWIQQYIKGCGVCQQNKVNMWPQKPPLYPITPKEEATPFSTIAMD
jgi:hypothetical protein